MSLFEEHKLFAQKVITVRDAILRYEYQPEIFKKKMEFGYNSDIGIMGRLSIDMPGLTKLMTVHKGSSSVKIEITRGAVAADWITYNKGINLVYDSFIKNKDSLVFIDEPYNEETHFQHSLLYSDEQLLSHVIYNEMNFNPICVPYEHCSINVTPVLINKLYEDINLDFI